MAHATVELSSLLYSTPGYKQGRPCLRGTGMTVHTVAAHALQGLSAEEICAEYPDLDPSLIMAGLAYYLANREAVEAELELDRLTGEALAREDWASKGRTE
jgi:uncharacterized protein (DUF433 family)